MKPTQDFAVEAAVRRPFAVSCLLLALAAPVWANQHEHQHGQDAQDDTAATVDEFVHAEVKAVDRDNGKLMLKHEAIRKFNMNGMTMGFRLADPKQIDALAVGDKVRFMPDRVNGQFVITKIEKLQ